MSDINKEIEETAEKMEKSTKTLREVLQEMGPEEIKKSLNSLSIEEKEALFNELMEMKKAKAVAMDDKYDPKIREGKLKDTVYYESEVDDDKDEELVKEEAAKQKQQGDNSPESIEGQVIKSILNDIEDLYDIDDEDLSELSKSFGNDLDLMADYLTTDDESLLEKANTVTRGGIRYYADGPNAGKKVGTIRGDKASINSIARARKKGKISTKAAQEGVKNVNREKSRSDDDKRFNEKTSLTIRGKQGKTLEAIRHNAAVSVATKESDDRIKESHEKKQEKLKAEKAAYEAAKANAKTKKDGTPHKKDQAKIDESWDTYKNKKSEVYSNQAKETADNIAQRRARVAELKEKRAVSIKKSVDSLNSDEELLKSFVEAALEKGKTFEELLKACEDKGIDAEKVKKIAKKETEEEVKEHEESMHDEKVETVAKSLEEEIFEDFSKSWEDNNQLIKANKCGRNHHFSVNAYYDDIIKKSKEEPKVEEKLIKSEKEMDTQDLIEGSLEKSWDKIKEEKALEANKSKINGKIVKSFSDEDMEALFPSKK